MLKNYKNVDIREEVMSNFLAAVNVTAAFLNNI